MADYIEVATIEQLPPGKSLFVRVSGKELALFNVDGTIFAIDDSCLHQGISLAASKFEGKVVTCSGHGWKYDVTTGSTLSSPGFGVASYPVKVIDGKILVEPESAENRAA